MEDEAIVALYHARDQQAIAETADKYGGYCHTIALHILTVREDAEECVNDTWHAAWRHMPPDRPRSLRAYLGRIVRNLSISLYRRRRAKKRYDGMEQMLSELSECIPSADSVEQAVERAELTRHIADWLDSLPADDRSLFVRRYWYGEPLKELAAACGCPPARLAQRMLRLRRSLRDVLTAKGVVL